MIFEGKNNIIKIYICKCVCVLKKLIDMIKIKSHCWVLKRVKKNQIKIIKTNWLVSFTNCNLYIFDIPTVKDTKLRHSIAIITIDSTIESITFLFLHLNWHLTRCLMINIVLLLWYIYFLNLLLFYLWIEPIHYIFSSSF